MSYPKILLQQKYFLSFLTTTLLITLTTQSSLAFSIKPVGPRGATQNWDPDESYTFFANQNQMRGTTTLSPTAVRNLARGGTTGFLTTLRRNFPTWNFLVASTALFGSFEVKTYDAVGTTNEGVGANFLLEYTPSFSDPKPDSGRLNWIQRVVDNHNITGNPGHGNQEDIIDNGRRTNNPFYFDPPPLSIGPEAYPFETKFADTPRRGDFSRNHNWLAEVYLVNHIGPKDVIIYNGIQWGWQNRVQSVPEPLTIFASGVCLGFGALFKKTVKGTGQNKTKSLEKLKN
jgi:hypothetical protein